MIKTIIMIGSVCLAMGLQRLVGRTAEPRPFAYPDTGAGRRVASYVRAFNTPDEGALRAFLTDNLAPAALSQLSLEAGWMHCGGSGNTGTLEPVRVRAAGATAITLTARTAKGEWLEMAFAFEPEPAPAAGRPVRTPGQPAGPGRTGDAYHRGRARGEAGTASRRSRRQGRVLRRRPAGPGRHTGFQKAYGLASQEYNVPNRLDTRFNVGSINKFITQIAIEQLAGKGKLQLDASIGTYLPDYPNPGCCGKGHGGRQLLDMTGGTGDFFGERYAATPRSESGTWPTTCNSSPPSRSASNRAPAANIPTAATSCWGSSSKKCPDRATSTTCASISTGPPG